MASTFFCWHIPFSVLFSLSQIFFFILFHSFCDCEKCITRTKPPALPISILRVLHFGYNFFLSLSLHFLLTFLVSVSFYLPLSIPISLPSTSINVFFFFVPHPPSRPHTQYYNMLTTIDRNIKPHMCCFHFFPLFISFIFCCCCFISDSLCFTHF